MAGSDRAGLASALYLAAIAGAGEEAAGSQLSIRYGHVGLPVVGAYAMDSSSKSLKPMVGFDGS